MDLAFWLAVLAAVLLAFMENHHWNKLIRVEKDLKEHLGDLLVQKDSCSNTCRKCRQSSVHAVKSLIRKHFSL